MPPKYVGENSDKTPSTWFLTHEGTKFAEQLVEEAKGAHQPQ